ncbi:unnamed protein product [Caenorhabditis bovis]|uniref:Sodium/potassium-transporting ATPase subunit beta n=1 Tax=Caenorhabditis bovis TaxID=2654633 RepID=A0A8S1F6P2_9PELO|nr:unnamed protein product [Caenorhabditis bovis]
MFSSGTTNIEQEEKKAFLDKSTRTANELSADASKSRKSTKTSVEKTITAPRGPKMSDGSEFDTGPYGWIFSIMYLLILWGICIAFSVALVSLHIKNMHPQFPTYFGDGSFIGGVPLVTFDPNPKRFLESRQNLMSFNIYDFFSYRNLLIRYKQVLKKSSGKKELCRTKKLTETEACKFDRVTNFGECVLDDDNLEHGFGFSKGQPCLMLKLNKIIGWYPSFLNNSNCPKTNLCCGEGIKFVCESDDDVNFEYYPKTGIPACYFPYANQKGYEQPYMMAKISNITFDKEVSITCSPAHSSLKKMENGKANELRFTMLMSKMSPTEAVA